MLRNMFQLKICVKRSLEVSRRREVVEFLEFIDNLETGMFKKYLAQSLVFQSVYFVI